MTIASHHLSEFLLALVLIGIIPAIGFAADADFAGTWKAEVKLQVANSPTGNGGRGGPISQTVTIPNGAGGTRTIDIVPDADGHGPRGGGIANVDLTGQRGLGGAGAPTAPPSAAPQKTHTRTYKMTLSIKIDKKGKWSGTWKVNDNRLEGQEWNVVGNKLTFVTIDAFRIPEYSFTAVWNDKELNIRQIPANGDPAREFTMKR